MCWRQATLATNSQDNLANHSKGKRPPRPVPPPLDEAWLAVVQDRWASHGDIPEDARAVLGRVLVCHERGDYEGCVARLMCLFEGLVPGLYDKSIELTDEQKEYVLVEAEHFRLEKLKAMEGEPKAPKDYLVVYRACAERGWLVYLTVGSVLHYRHRALQQEKGS